MSNKIEINPMVAYSEASALNEFYRNRCMALANKLSEITDQMTVVTNERDMWLEEMQRLQLLQEQKEGKE